MAPLGPCGLPSLLLLSYSCFFDELDSHCWSAHDALPQLGGLDVRRDRDRLGMGMVPITGFHTMPRRRDPAEARTEQITVAVREADAEKLRAEAKRLGISLSRYAYCRLVAPAHQPQPNPSALMAAGSIGRIGGLLNQIAHLAHVKGFNTELFLQAVALTQEYQRVLRSMRC